MNLWRLLASSLFIMLVAATVAMAQAGQSGESQSKQQLVVQGEPGGGLVELPGPTITVSGPDEIVLESGAKVLFSISANSEAGLDMLELASPGGSIKNDVTGKNLEKNILVPIQGVEPGPVEYRLRARDVQGKYSEWQTWRVVFRAPPPLPTVSVSGPGDLRLEDNATLTLAVNASSEVGLAAIELSVPGDKKEFPAEGNSLSLNLPIELEGMPGGETDFLVRAVDTDGKHSRWAKVRVNLIKPAAPPVATLGGPAEIVVMPGSMTITLALDAEGEAGLKSYELRHGNERRTGDLTGVTVSLGLDVVLNNPVVGSLLFEVRVEDVEGRWTEWRPHSVAVVAPPAPKVVIHAPASSKAGRSRSLNVKVDFTAAGGLQQYEYFFAGVGDVVSGSLSGTEQHVDISIPLDSVQPGEQEFRVRASNAYGTWSEWVSESIELSGPSAPQVTIAGPAEAIVNTGEVVLAYTVTDDDLGLVKVELLHPFSSEPVTVEASGMSLSAEIVVQTDGKKPGDYIYKIRALNRDELWSEWTLHPLTLKPEPWPTVEINGTPVVSQSKGQKYWMTYKASSATGLKKYELKWRLRNSSFTKELYGQSRVKEMMRGKATDLRPGTYTLAVRFMDTEDNWSPWRTFKLTVTK